MTLSHRIGIAFITLLAAVGVTVGAAWLGYQTARAEAPDYTMLVAEKGVDGTWNPYRDFKFAELDEHRLVVKTLDGDTHEFFGPSEASLDGKPILLAQADTADASAGSAPRSPPAAAPADKLHDPISAPSQAWDDLKAAKKVGWPVLVFALLVMLCKLLARARRYKLLAVLGKGKTAVVVGAFGAVGTACYNAAAEGGAWTAMLFAGLIAIGHYLDAGEKKPDAGGN